ncbi:protein kinase domain-containing protein [Acinetobacter sp. MD2]|uniref:protein kinase domain-containing protein n=1 Tax=Acinetobacter sp. MD2 TaxID=2600066 RepID=UPI002D1E776C|nr:protein kinase [Acinetobacter sp. MD2]MEB3767854.1 protein kinase [Acinetobacter sp. MD2]
MTNPLFNPQDYALMIEKTPLQSLALGRHIYLLQQEAHYFWLKAQDASGHPQWMNGFQRELEIYHHYSSATFILPAQLLKSDPQQAFPNLLKIEYAAPALSELQCLSIRQIQQKLYTILDAVAALHQSGWLHGDLKASHLRQYGQQVKLIDFEQAQLIVESKQLQPMDATPRYMAPELFHLAAKSVQSDLYALGIVFYEWLSTRKIQIVNYDDWAVYHCQQSDFQLPEHLQQFQALLNGLLAKQKTARFITAQHAMQCLNACEWLGQ